MRSGWRRGALARPGPAWGCLRRVGEGAGGRPRDPARRGTAGSSPRAPVITGLSGVDPPRTGRTPAPVSRNRRATSRPSTGPFLSPVALNQCQSFHQGSHRSLNSSGCAWRRRWRPPRPGPGGEQVPQGGDLVGLVGHPPLGQGRAGGLVQGRQEVGGRVGAGAGPAHGLAVHGDHRSAPDGAGAGEEPRGRRGRRGPRGPGPSGLCGWSTPMAGPGPPDRPVPGRRRARASPTWTPTIWGSGHGVPRCTAFVTGPVRDGRIVSRGHQHAHGAPTTRPAPWNRRPGARKHRDGGDPRRPGPPATTDPSHLPIACTGRLVDEGIEASAGAVGSSLRRRRRPGPGQAPLQARGPFWRDGP